MEQRHGGNEGADESGVPVARIVQRVWSRMGRCVHSDLRDDCELEARLVLWRCRERLARLPEGERAAYGRRVAWNAAVRVVTVEIDVQEGTVSLEALGEEVLASEGRDEWQAEWEWLRSDRLLPQIGRPDIAAAVGALRETDRELLDMLCVELLTNEAIAGRLRCTLEAVKGRRKRLMKALRTRLGVGGRGTTG